MAEKIIDNREILKTLRKINPVLNPIELGDIFHSYKDFTPHRKGFGLWSTTETLPKILANYMQQDNIILEISGVAAGGKDAIRETIQKLSPNLLFKAVTATSRKAREGEVDGEDYYFYKDAKTFEEAIARGEFVEWVKQGNRFYGLPKKSLSDALDKKEPVVVTHVEMKSGWPAIDDVVNNLTDGKNVFPLKVFVLPNMSFGQYAEEWLPKKRDDIEARLERAAWEISVAASKADIIVTNTFGKDSTALEWQSQAIANHCIMLLKKERAKGLNIFQTPFQISPGISGNQKILDYHESLIKK